MRRGIVCSGLLAMLAVACGSRTPLGTGASSDAGLSFPTGTFTHCTEGEHGSEPNLFLGGVGLAEQGSLTVSVSGSGSGAALHATYVGVSGHATELDFRALTSRTAIGVDASSIDGFTGLCVEGIGFNHEHPFPATMQVSHATLTYSGGAMFLAASGDVAGDGGSCGILRETATRWVVCTDGPPVPDAPPPAPVASKLTSPALCTAQLATFYVSGSQKQLLSSGGDGEKMSVMPSSASVASDTSGPWWDGALVLRTETPWLGAIATAGQKGATPCQVPVETRANDRTPEALDVGGAVLDGEGSETMLLFHGTMSASSSCAGAEKVGALFCAKP